MVENKNQDILIQYSNDKRLEQNNLFDSNIDVNLSVFKSLKNIFESLGFNLCTVDTKKSCSAKALIFYNLPFFWDLKSWKVILCNPKKCILVLIEPSIVNPFNYFKVLHKFFIKIYTWNPDLTDSKKYFSYNIGQSLFGMSSSYKKDFSKKKFLTLVSGNKVTPKIFLFLSKLGICPGKELYSERIKLIEYFETHFPSKFSFYGRGWNQIRPYSIFEKILGFKSYETYRGNVKNKIELLSEYKFSICFENMTKVNGYLTEKLFDCLKAKCVPIYWGAEDITQIVPVDCFIDYRQFKDGSALMKFLENISEENYNKYISNIENLLSDEEFKNKWFDEGWARSFAKSLIL